MKSVLKIAVLAIAATLVSGCSVVNQAGAAATVGDVRITNDEVRADYENIVVNVGDGDMQLTATEINRAILRYRILNVLTRATAEDMGVAVSEAEVNARYSEEISQAGSESALLQLAAMTGIPSTQMKPYLETMMNLAAVSQRISGSEEVSDGLDAALAKLAEKAIELNVQISLRYGAWNNTNLDIADGINEGVVTIDQLAALQAQAAQ